jgi:hypothetical protein
VHRPGVVCVEKTDCTRDLECFVLALNMPGRYSRRANIILGRQIAINKHFATPAWSLEEVLLRLTCKSWKTRMPQAGSLDIIVSSATASAPMIRRPCDAILRFTSRCVDGLRH